MPLAAIKSILDSNSFEVFPVPAEDKIIINFKTSVNQITLTDMVGKELYRIAEKSPHFIMDISDIPGGIYFITGFGSTGKVCKKIIKN
jgi:hypothetical protein